MSASDFGCAAPAAPHASAAKSSITLMATARIGVMLVDDHAVVRMGFTLLLDAAPDMRTMAWSSTRDRKSTRLNSSHGHLSHAVLCLIKKEHGPSQYLQSSRCFERHA